MTVRYDIRVIHHGRRDRVLDLQAAVAGELRDLGLQKSVEVDVREGAGPERPNAAPAVAVYVGDEAAAADADVLTACEQAMAEGVVVIPVVDDLERYERDVPAVLVPLNGIAWNADAVARLLLTELGIEERQRRVFISHHREDGLGAAEQLHDALAHHCFLPFIDRFAIPYGAPVQETIADALENYAFLLLLETPRAWTSEWVFDEVEYALSHTMGVVIIRWPGDTKPVPGSKRLERLQLSPRDLITDAHRYEILTASALDRVIAEIEHAHAYGLVRRRRMLVLSVEEAARAAGATTCTPLPDWRILIEHRGASSVVGVSPRLPTASDLQDLDAARTEADPAAGAVLVHSARVLRSDRAAHLKWVQGSRQFELIPENAIGGRWR